MKLTKLLRQNYFIPYCFTKKKKNQIHCTYYYKFSAPILEV